jgi:hypothetical protein
MVRMLAYHLLRWDQAMFAKNFANLSKSYSECRGRLHQFVTSQTMG